MTDKRKFWERCGFREKPFKEFVHGPLMHGGKQYEKAWFAPNGDNWLDRLPPADLNSLFLYAVPKLIKKYDIKIFSFYDDLNDTVFWFVHILDRVSDEAAFANIGGKEELKDALFEAIWEAIKK